MEFNWVVAALVVYWSLWRLVDMFIGNHLSQQLAAINIRLASIEQTHGAALNEVSYEVRRVKDLVEGLMPQGEDSWR
jgi:hypothetical protein